MAPVVRLKFEVLGLRSLADTAGAALPLLAPQDERRRARMHRMEKVELVEIGDWT